MASNPSPLLYAAESWEKVYQAFEQINFTAYDYIAVKESLIDYLKFNYPENFNDYHEASLMIAIIELFAYAAEQISYRVDFSVHEITIGNAQRKKNILNLVKLISYAASRNLPLRGLVKITGVSISENVTDSQGNSLTNRVVRWNDANNPLWREQFLTVINKILTQPFGSPLKSFQLDDTVFQQYELQNVLETEAERASFRNGVLKFKTTVNGTDLDFELVPVDVDANGVFERSPNPNSYFTIAYANDGFGDSSDTTGFMMYTKQGVLTKLTYLFDLGLPNRILDINIANVNDADVWVQSVDAQGVISAEWENIPNVNGENLSFNDSTSTKKYEIETLEDDKVRLIFGDGDFAEIPTGSFNIWVRSSTSGGVTVPKSQIVDQTATFLYTSKTGKQESCTLTYSLTAALQNSAVSEDIEHIRAAAPATYYTQNRMVNGQDYNTFPLSDPSILLLRTVNRTFAGQSKYLDWNDASGSYQNLKVFGNDLRMYYNVGTNSSVVTTSARSLIDNVIEPALSNPGIYNLLVYAFYSSSSPLNLAFIRPRTRFIEDATQLLDDSSTFQEKTLIQGALDRHWYGEPDAIALLDTALSETSSLPKAPYAIVNDDTDQLVYDPNIKLVTKDYITGVYTLVPTLGNISGIQESVIRQKRFGIAFDPDQSFKSKLRIQPFSSATPIADADSLTSADVVQLLGTVETYTIEITNDNGDGTATFSVYGSVTGVHPSGITGEPYTDGVLSFLIDFPASVDTTIVLGDAYIIDVQLISSTYTPFIYRKNLRGRFKLIDEAILPSNAETLPYDVHDDVRSWIMIIERFDNDSGVAYWKVTQRDYQLTVESTTTKFWFNQNLKLVDPDTKKDVHDQIRVLKSNLNVERTQALGFDQVYDVVDAVRYPDGTVNPHALVISPVNLLDLYYSGAGTPVNPVEFLRFIGPTDYVYFSVDSSTGKLTPVATTAYLEGLTYVDGVSGSYVRKSGRADLDFLWQHFTPDDHLVDPSPTNINDMYVLTRGYYSGIQNFLRGLSPVLPTPPTSLELRNTYRTLLESKMISDSVVMHSGTVKFLFGSQADPELRAIFKIVRATSAKLTGDQIRSRVLDLINQYFNINNWDFGQDFYATELLTVIQSKLPTEIASIVLVPVFPANYFGDLFFLRSAPNEVFVSCATLNEIEVVSGIDRLTLKQR